MKAKGSEFLPYYIQLIINFSSGIGFEKCKR